MTKPIDDAIGAAPGQPGEAQAGAGQRTEPDQPGDAATADAATPPVAGLPGDAVTEAELEALLFVAERPLRRRELAALTGASPETIDARLGDLEVSLAGRGIRLVVADDRVALATAPLTGAVVTRYVGGAPARLSPAMAETLAIVAYRQPVTRSTVERIRGVDSDYVLRSLLHRRLVVELGRSPSPGRPILYGTGYEFLERFGLVSLDDLPPLEAAVAGRLDAETDRPVGPAAGASPDDA